MITNDEHDGLTRDGICGMGIGMGRGTRGGTSFGGLSLHIGEGGASRGGVSSFLFMRMERWRGSDGRGGGSRLT
jgi:hypothetical protein